MEGTNMEFDDGVAGTIDLAREALRNADALLIGAGAGFGVDSGLPDFRGSEGFWQAYPPYRNLGLGFSNLANPRFFKTDPEVAWGFYGHRQALYRETAPHRGFEMLRAFGDSLAHGSYVYTSNVDGQFKKAGFSKDSVAECHGTIHHLQCSVPCNSNIWQATFSPMVDLATMRALGELPRCPSCGAVARPNILMFGDAGWVARRTSLQEEGFREWLSGLGRNSRLVIMEFGAGTAVPSVRSMSETIARRPHTTLIRVNPREAAGPRGTLSLPLGSLDACKALFERQA